MTLLAESLLPALTVTLLAFGVYFCAFVFFTAFFLATFFTGFLEAFFLATFLVAFFLVLFLAFFAFLVLFFVDFLAFLVAFFAAMAVGAASTAGTAAPKRDRATETLLMAFAFYP
ncbi:hypothetical protein [Lactobacillus delbrueckii]|uniref:hypothetical protein n=1 Tax=Lactobacillus delbrueckii TaxID=1584 RepID=UPI0018C88E84|nr:hypothetical protein [Lactobacillus delbrueckii]